MMVVVLIWWIWVTLVVEKGSWSGREGQKEVDTGGRKTPPLEARVGSISRASFIFTFETL